MSVVDEQGEEWVMWKLVLDLCLFGLVVEILVSFVGLKVGVFFDLDGMLVVGFMVVIFIQERLWCCDMGVGELFGMVQVGLNYMFG